MNQKNQIQIGHVVFVACRGMFSNANILALNTAGYKFIAACKLKNLDAKNREEIFDKNQGKS